jgi:hypothetical protein
MNLKENKLKMNNKRKKISIPIAFKIHLKANYNLKKKIL